MNSPKILIVDDNPSNLKLLRVLLTGEGFSVRTATSAEQALLAARQEKPAVVLADIQMPGMDGLEMTRRLKAEAGTKDVPVIAVTAYAMSGDEDKARAAGCDAYVPKPIDTRALPGLIRRVLGQTEKP